MPTLHWSARRQPETPNKCGVFSNERRVKLAQFKEAIAGLLDDDRGCSRVSEPPLILL